MKIIAFAGMPCSGKSEAVQIARDMKIPVIRMGDMVWDEVKAQGLPLDDAHVGKIANDMRKKHGKDIWAQKTLAKIQALPQTERIVIDGIRNTEEIDLFKTKLGADFKVIAITASDEIRRKRVLSRGRSDDSDIKDFIARDKRELGWGLGKVITSADITIPNETTIAAFRMQIKAILAQL